MKTVFKGYIIGSYAETRLVGGPYENNEERQYRETGKTLFSITNPKKHQYFPPSESLKEAKSKVTKHLNVKRTKRLQKRHASAVRKLVATKAELGMLENALREIGADYEIPRHGLSW
jgi:hypothetical protein